LNNDNPLWCERYRPQTVSETIIPSDLKAKFQTFIDNNVIPNLLLTGGAGVGKTTVARAMLEELGCDYIIINGSMNGNIDTLRTEIKQFASSVSLTGGRKYVILDEADYLNPASTQPGLRNFMEEYSKNCGFILTCNFKNRIIEPLHSRCSVIEFKIDSKDKPEMAKQFFSRIKYILDKEEVKYEPKVIAAVITKHFPDNRRVLNELQGYAVGGEIDSGILDKVSDVRLNGLFSYMKEKNFTEVRKWTANNIDIDTNALFNSIYKSSNEYIKPGSIPQLVLIIADYQYKAAFVADQEINTVACLVEIMSDCEFA